MESEKSTRQVFRNKSANKTFYLKSRDPHSQENFQLRPGMSVEAMDEAEERLLASMSFDLVDVAKESPAVQSNLDSLQKQLAEARAQNEALKAEKEALEKKVSQVSAQASGRQTVKR